MRQTTRNSRESNQRNGLVAKQPNLVASWSLFCMVALAILVFPKVSFADSGVGSSGAQANIQFRIVIPAIIRVTPVTQPEHIVIEDRHVAQGYIDLDAGTSVRLTNNTRNGYMLTANYDAQLLSSVEVRVSNHNMTASSGVGSIRVVSGLAVDKLVPIGYRLNLAKGVQTGQYRWPVALAFSLAAA